MNQWTADEKKDIPSQYGCELIHEKANEEQIKDQSLPNDAYQVIYEISGKVYTDICRGSRVRIFDLYYDKFGPGVIKNIIWGYGKTSPKLWGYKKPERKKR